MKKTKKLLALILALCSLFSLVACGSGSGDGEEGSSGGEIDHDRLVTYASATMVTNFNMKYVTAANDIAATDQVYDCLVRKVNGQIIGYLATDWEISEDGLDWTFYLRQGVTWSDGEPFTAEDVKFSAEFIRDECAQWAWAYQNLEDVEIVDDYTVIYHFSKADASLLSTMCSGNYGGIFAKHAYEQWGEDYGTSADKIVGTGPYVVTAWEENVSVTFEAREDYFMGAPDIKHLKYVAIADANAAAVALQTGELDQYMNPVTGVNLDTLRAADNVTISEAITCRCESIYMNCETGIFTDVRMRQAVAYAINKQEALDVCGSGQGEVLIYPCDLGDLVTANPDFIPSHTYDYDVEKAKALVEECGNVGAEVVIKSYNTEPYATMSVWLQGALNAIGLDAKVETMERSTFLDQCLNGEVTICPFSWSNTSFDFGAAVGVYMNSANIGISGNYGRYNNPEADALIAKGNAAMDEEERKAAYRELIELYMEDVPSVAMYANKNAIAHSSQLTCDDATQYMLSLYHWAA